MRFARRTVPALLAVAAGLSGQTTRLELGKTIAADLSGEETKSYSVTLEANQYLRAVITQLNPAVLVELYRPDGRKVLEVDTRNSFKPSRIIGVADAAGEYRISVSVPSQTTDSKHYDIKLEELRTAVADDSKRAEAERLFTQGLGEARRNANDQAIAAYRRALGLYREVKDHDREGDTLTATGSAYNAVGQQENAISYFEQALAIWREVKDRLGECHTLNNLGEAYASLSQYEKAIDYYEQALAIWREIRDRLGEGNALNALATAYYYLSQYEKAIFYFEQTLSIHREAKNRRGESVTLYRLGVAYWRLSQYEKGIGYFEQALAIALEIKDPDGEAKPLNGLGGAYRSLGQYEKAIGYYERALTIWREIKDRPNEGTILNNLGEAYYYLSQHERAINYYQQALVIARETKDRRSEGITLGGIGQAFQGLSQHEKAIGYYEQALAIKREVRDRQAEGGELSDLGTAYQELNQYENAIGYYTQALAISREVKDRRGEGNALNNLGETFQQMGLREKAIGYDEQALAIYREIKDRDTEGEALTNLGVSYRDLSQYERAIAYFEQALTISREVKNRKAETKVLSELMETWRAFGKSRLAVFYGKQAVNVIQSIRGDIRGLRPESRKSFLEGNKDKYRKLTDVLVSQGRLIEAQQTLALLKQQEFFDYAGDNATAKQTERIGLTLDEANWAERYRRDAEALSDQGAAIADLQDRIKKQPSLADSPDTQHQIAELQTALEIDNRKFQQFLSELKQHFDKTPEATAISIDLKETERLKADLIELKHGAVAIYTLVTPDRYVAILVTPNGQKDFQTTIKSAELGQKILAFREAIENPRSDPKPLAQELYNILIPAALAEDLRKARAETLMWSLDGPLRYVPVAALHDGKQYLVEKYRTTVFTAASDARLTDLPQPKWRAVGLGVSEAHPGFAALPAVADELRGIVRETPGEAGVLEGRRLLDANFTRAAMDRELMGGFSVVHVASHFQFSPGDSNRSFLLLGDGSRLTLANIKAAGTIFKGVDLLTLSACSTGLGDVKMSDGGEVEGFGVLAQRAGAKAVVASLWPVVDTSTGLLMQQFYRIRQSDSKLTKIEALRRAQLRLLNGGIKLGGMTYERGVKVAQESDRARDYRHPYYWAPFFLMGNWL